jgi:hypothetical protein
MKRKAKTYFEQSAVYWRKALKYFKRPGVSRKAKRQMNRRERHQYNVGFSRLPVNAGGASHQCKCFDSYHCYSHHGGKPCELRDPQDSM